MSFASFEMFLDDCWKMAILFHFRGFSREKFVVNGVISVVFCG